MTASAEVDALAQTLIEANDLLLGLYELADLAATSLDESESVHAILTHAQGLLRADALVLMTPTRRVGVGSAGAQRDLDMGAPGRFVASVEAERSAEVAGELRVTRTCQPFGTGDRKMLRAVLSFLLGAIETARLHDRALNSALGEQDLRRASEVAQLALPTSRPIAAGLDVFVHTEQARQTGGDLFCFDIDGDHFRFAVGDVSGKGLTAAVVMTTAICAAQAAFRDPVLVDPGQHMLRINDWMYDHLANAGMFLTLFVGDYDKSTGELRWSNAGQSPCLVRSGGEVNGLDAHVPPIGVLPTIQPRTERTVLGSDDLVLVGTDGLVEQTSLTGEAFGEERLRQMLLTERSVRADELGASLIDCIRAFAAGLPQADDQLMVLLRHDGSPS